MNFYNEVEKAPMKRRSLFALALAPFLPKPKPTWNTWSVQFPYREGDLYAELIDDMSSMLAKRALENIHMTVAEGIDILNGDTSVTILKDAKPKSF